MVLASGLTCSSIAFIMIPWLLTHDIYLFWMMQSQLYSTNKTSFVLDEKLCIVCTLKVNSFRLCQLLMLWRKIKKKQNFTCSMSASDWKIYSFYLLKKKKKILCDSHFEATNYSVENKANFSLYATPAYLMHFTFYSTTLPTKVDTCVDKSCFVVPLHL